MRWAGIGAFEAPGEAVGNRLSLGLRRETRYARRLGAHRLETCATLAWKKGLLQPMFV
jgi:hypothetical protein